VVEAALDLCTDLVAMVETRMVLLVRVVTLDEELLNRQTVLEVRALSVYQVPWLVVFTAVVVVVAASTAVKVGHATVPVGLPEVAVPRGLAME
jgi:hypothetical protein